LRLDACWIPWALWALSHPSKFSQFIARGIVPEKLQFTLPRFAAFFPV
jgi:hypothetical protein